MIIPGDVNLGDGHVVVVLEDRQLLRVPERYGSGHVSKNFVLIFDFFVSLFCLSRENRGYI